MTWAKLVLKNVGNNIKIRKSIAFLFIVVIFIFSACSSKDKIDITAKELIDKDLSDDISINRCLHNVDSNAIYVEFYSSKHGNDEAIILLDDDSILYSSVYSTIKEDDYAKIIEYGDYAVMMYQIVMGDESWAEIDISK